MQPYPFQRRQSINNHQSRGRLYIFIRIMLQTILLQFALLGVYRCSAASHWGQGLIHSNRWLLSWLESPLFTLRGGSDEDEGRYSRQVYTLGSKAHALIRSSTVYLDGPLRSGLLFEVGKNLALSGVRRLVVVVSKNAMEQTYHNYNLDDLGLTFQQGARSEINDVDACLPDEELLVEYLQRLNPNIEVSFASRDDIARPDLNNNPAVYMSIDRPYMSDVQLNRLARCKSWKYVSVETAGVFGKVFCDFGDKFQVWDADGETPIATPLLQIEIFAKNIVSVHCVEGEKHDVSKGDQIQFQYRNGELSEQQCVVTEIHSPYRFRVQIIVNDGEDLDDFIDKINMEAAAFRRVKVPVDLCFQSLEATLDISRTESSLFTPCDLNKGYDEVRRITSLSCFLALSEFVQANSRLPCNDDLNTFAEMARGSMPASDEIFDKDDSTKHCKMFVHGCAAKFAPFQAFLGAIAAQEALKGATGLYNPIRQFLLYDCDEVLLSRAPKTKEAKLGNKDDCLLPARGLRYILGDRTVNKLQQQRVFVVGSGAIGCEYLKNLASMGISTGKEGILVLTDMDTIEKSNLSRQFLFRDADIGKFKSAAAREATLRLNPAMKIEAHSSKVGGTGHVPFDDQFWSSKVDIVLNALDNMEARIFMDSQCVINKKALVDAGTMGAKGNVQVVVPFKSESYASSVDPPEPGIAVCTLKNFPYAISHTIQWGRDLFDGIFQKRPEQANSFIDNCSFKQIKDVAEKFVHEKGIDAALELARNLKEDLADYREVKTVRDYCLSWASELAWKLFNKASVDLLYQHPLNSVDEDGEPFWSGTRTPPKVLVYNVGSADPHQSLINENLISFVKHAARLRVETILGKELQPGDSTIARDDAVNALVSIGQHSSISDGDFDDASLSAVDHVCALLENGVTRPRKMAPIEFEKDDDSNGHVAFITAASNLRAIAYGIPPVDTMETRRIAGNIIPAMITCTSVVSALSCIELVKLVQKAELKLFRNAFVNLALPFFAFTAPLPAERFPGLNGRSYTMWDHLAIKEGKNAAASGGMAMRSLLKKIKKQAADDSSQVSVTSISCGPYMLYANFLHENDPGVLESSLWELIEDALSSSENFDNDFSRDDENSQRDEYVFHEKFVDLTVVVEDVKTGDEVELPPVRVERFREEDK